MLRDLTTLVAVLGGCLYALIALAYERFYRVLGIAPKDVGIAPGAIVARTAVAVAIFVAVGGATYFTCFAVLSIVLPRSTPGTTALAALAVVAVLGPLVIAASIAEVFLSGPFLVITGLLAVVLLAASLGTIWVLRRRPSPRGRVAVVAVWAAVLAFFFCGGVVFSLLRADGQARSVLDGRQIPPSGLTFVFDVHADPVCVAVDTTAEAKPRPAYRLYLGEANGWLALYDPVNRVTERLSNEGRSLTFLTQPAAQAC